MAERSERPLHPTLVALSMMDLRPLVEETPNEDGKILEGPFRLKLALPDNSATPVNLLTATQWLHKDYQTVYGSSNTPSCLFHFEGCRLLIVPNNEPPESLAEYISNAVITFGRGTRTRTYSIMEGVGPFFPNGAITTTKTDITRVEPFGDVDPFILPDPKIINFREDTFTLGTINAVNMSASITAYLELYGAIWPESVGRPVARPARNSAKEALEAKRDRAAMRVRIGAVHGRISR